MYQVEGLNVIYVPFIIFEVIGKSMPFSSILNFIILSECNYLALIYYILIMIIPKGEGGPKCKTWIQKFGPHPQYSKLSYAYDVDEKNRCILYLTF